MLAVIKILIGINVLFIFGIAAELVGYLEFNELTLGSIVGRLTWLVIASLTAIILSLWHEAIVVHRELSTLHCRRYSDKGYVGRIDPTIEPEVANNARMGAGWPTSREVQDEY